MARAAKEIIEFEEDELAPLLDALGRLHGVEGWLNLTPGVPAEVEVAQDGGLLAFFTGSRRLEAPLATWMPTAAAPSGTGTMGVLHNRGRLHRDGLAGLVSIPASWRCTQDHARRGLLFEVSGASDLELAESMVAVVEELATVTTTGRYLAELFLRS